MLRPANPDAFLDDPKVHKASRESDYMPYWPYLWGSAPEMARLVLETSWNAGTRTLEVGAGIGLVGLAALTAGLDVTFSDYDATAVRLAVANAALNGFPRSDGLVFDWRNLELLGRTDPFPLILGCDVIYERQIHNPLLDVLDRLLAHDGVCWLADPGRTHVSGFADQARERGFVVEFRDAGFQRRANPAMNEFQLLILHADKA